MCDLSSRPSCAIDAKNVPRKSESSCNYACNFGCEKKSLQKAALYLLFRSISTVWLSTSLFPVEIQEHLSICPSFLSSRERIVKWPSQSNPRAVSKQLRIRIFWKESVGIFPARSLVRSVKCLPETENFPNYLSVFDSDIESTFLSLSWSFPSIILIFGEKQGFWLGG